MGGRVRWTMHALWRMCVLLPSIVKIVHELWMMLALQRRTVLTLLLIVLMMLMELLQMHVQVVV